LFKPRTSSSDLLIVLHQVKTVPASLAFHIADSFNVFKKRRLKCHLFDEAFKTTDFQPASHSRKLAASQAANFSTLNQYNFIVL